MEGLPAPQQFDRESFRAPSNLPELKRGVKLIDIQAKTEASDRHPGRNEDAMLCLPEQGVFGVFDGMGGHTAGEKASKLARDCARGSFITMPNNLSLEQVQGSLLKILQDADTLIRQEAQGNGMGTTGAIGKIWQGPGGERKVVIAHVGDSRVYLLRQGRLEQITLDQSGIAEENGEQQAREIQKKLSNVVDPRQGLNPREQYYFRTRNQIAGAIGLEGSVPALQTVDLLPGDRLMVCSDGVSDNLTDTEIQRILANHPDNGQAVVKLAEEAKLRSRDENHLRAKSDDITALVLEPTSNQRSRSEQIRVTMPSSIRAAESFEQLFAYLKTIKGLQGSEEFYTNEELRRRINLVRSGKEPTNVITGAEGLRKKVSELLMN